MFDQYFSVNEDGGLEYGRCVSLIHHMVDAVYQSHSSATPGSLMFDVDLAFSDAPPKGRPSDVLRNALDNSLRNLQHVGNIMARSDEAVSVPAIMSCIRIALLGSSHLCYVVSGTVTATAVERMGGLYQLEIGSSRKCIDQIDLVPSSQHGLDGLCPPSGTEIRNLAAYTNPHPPKGRLSESALLTNLKESVLAPLLENRLSVDRSVGALLTDHLFNTTSGAAHGYAWIDLDGVVAEFVTQFSWATNVANIVFSDYMKAIGRLPSTDT